VRPFLRATSGVSTVCEPATAHCAELPTSTSNRYEALQEQPESGKGKAKWHFNPLFAPAAEDIFRPDLANQLPTKAFADWWSSPAATMQEAEDRIQAAAKISQNRKEFYADPTLNTPESVHEAAASLVHGDADQAPPGKRVMLSEDAAAQAPGTRSSPQGPSPQTGTIPAVQQTTYNDMGCVGASAERTHGSSADAPGSGSSGPTKKEEDGAPRARSRSPVPKEDRTPKGKGTKGKSAPAKNSTATPTFMPDMAPHESKGWTPHNLEVLRLYTIFFENEVIFTRMETSEV